MENVDFDVGIVGGGLAGLTAAIHLAKAGKKIVVFEKQHYPHHKVCGEYVSNEVRPYLESLGVPLNRLPIAKIDHLLISTQNGKSVHTPLPLGGFGISRHTFDLLLYQTAKRVGATFVFEAVSEINFNTDRFTITTTKGSAHQTEHTIGAYGKRSGLDKKLNRAFSGEKSPWLGVKCHYEYKDFPEGLVALHNFEGGYGGLSKTETGAVNFCYLTTFASFKKHKNIADFNANVVAKNPHLGAFLQDSKPLFEEPLTIAQISFAQKNPVVGHILMCGDSAGLIHPLCGNGMAMAIHAAKLASETLLKSNYKDRNALEKEYEGNWKLHFAQRLRMGRQLQRLLLNSTASNMAMATIANSEKIVRAMIRRTHGKPILVS